MKWGVRACETYKKNNVFGCKFHVLFFYFGVRCVIIWFQIVLNSKFGSLN